MTIPVTAIIATKNRARFLRRTLTGLVAQSVIPEGVIVVDASSDEETARLCAHEFSSAPMPIRYVRALKPGAASQREQGIQMAATRFIWFIDDDIVFEADCTRNLWGGFSAADVGAVNAMITNQSYQSPGVLSRWMLRLLNGSSLPTYAGRVIGPAWNWLPENRPDCPEYQSCDWLNTTCTMYRVSALPRPVFDPFFTGYSMMEDVALSIQIGKSYRLLNARLARIYHDSQPGDYKADISELSRMSLVNRYFVMTRVMGRTGVLPSAQLMLLELFTLISILRQRSGWRMLPATLWGKCKGMYDLIRLS